MPKRCTVYAGFGSLCIVPQLLFPFLLSEALMGMAFPLFVLMACESDPQAQFKQGKQCTQCPAPLTDIEAHRFTSAAAYIAAP